ncbi:hypothetical protein Tco_0305026 [Tanacetum coccineum]
MSHRENYSPQPGTIADHPAGPPLLSATTITAKPPAVVPSAEGLIQLQAEMKAIEDAITAKTIPPKTDREMLDEVLKRTNRAHIASLGRNLACDRAFRIWGGPHRTQVLFFTVSDSRFIHSSSVSWFYLYSRRPSSTSPVPSSTPLGLGDCYTRTFDPETSQCGEQDDNDSDNGNREYDVDIYDDE